MPFDPVTMQQLLHQSRRMRHALHETLPPDRREAELIQRRVDDILDRRPKPVGTTSDGEILWENQSPWVLAQIGADTIPALPEPDPEPPSRAHDIPPGTATGGVGLMDCPTCGRLGRYCGHDR